MTNENPYRPEDDYDSTSGAEENPTRKPRITRIVPDALRNWQVADGDARPVGYDDGLPDEWADIWDEAWAPLEFEGETLEGEATVVETPPAPLPTPQADTPSPPFQKPITDLHDNVIVAGLDSDHLVINPGMSAAFQVRVLNNGPRRASFGVHVEGWIDERWITVYPINTQLQPGEQATLTVAIAPPRSASSLAGDYAVAIVVRSADYPERRSRLGATLTLNAFDEIAPGAVQPRRAQVSWHRQTATVRLPVSNRGNRPIIVRVRGRADTPSCRFDFVHPHSGAQHPGECLLELPPGESAGVAVRITPDALPLISLRPQVTLYWLSATVADQARAPREVGGQLLGRPLIGLWQLFAAAALAAGALLIVALVGLGGLFTMQLATRAAQPAPEPAVVAVMLSMEQPAPTAPATIPATEPVPVAQAPGVDRTTAQPVAAQSDAPIVRPDQVSAPVEGQVAGAPIVSASAVSAPSSSGLSAPTAQPLAPAPPQPGAGMTYSQMFRDIGLRYDLDWRMLAAQAYVESKFDSVALGANGDLGLMQVLPATWREWSPVVGATDPFDSYGNVLVAAAYLNYLRDLFGQRGYVEPKWMLVAYNWGPDKLLAYIDGGGRWEELSPSLRRYAEDVLGIAAGIPAE